MSKFSVLIAVYNGDNPEDFKSALQSIFSNSIIPNQVVLVIDGPINSRIRAVVDEFSNDLDIVQLEYNQGLFKALNVGLLDCKHEFVFRCDADDVNDKNRFARQLTQMLELKCDVLGSQVLEIGVNEIPVALKQVPLKNDAIIKAMNFKNPMNHMSVLYRRGRVLDAGGYPALPGFEDYALWLLLRRNNCVFANDVGTLVNARVGNGFVHRRSGISYLRKICSFYGWCMTNNVMPLHLVIVGVVLRCCISVMPKSIIEQIYTKFLRGQVKI